MQEDLYSRKLTGRWGILFAIIFVASTLRSPLTSVGPVIEQIKSALTLNNSLAGSLTTIPLLIFAVVSPFVSRIAKRLTVPRTVLWAMIFTHCGTLHPRARWDVPLHYRNDIDGGGDKLSVTC